MSYPQKTAKKTTAKIASATFWPPPNPSERNTTRPSAPKITLSISPSTIAAMNREPTPANVRLRSTPSGVVIVKRSS
jgi:hypothetical protein